MKDYTWALGPTALCFCVVKCDHGLNRAYGLTVNEAAEFWAPAAVFLMALMAIAAVRSAK